MARVTTRRLELGARLRDARGRAGISSKLVEDRLGWHIGKVSRMETGTRVPVRAEIDVLATLYGLSDTDREAIHSLANLARKRDRAPSSLPDFARGYFALVVRASSVDFMDAELVPGLLQTEGYARALLAVSGLEGELLAERMEQQAALRQPTPPKVRVLLGEAVLHRLVGGPQVLAEQLRRLVEAGETGVADVRIIPFALGAHRSLGVGFTIVRTSDPDIERVYIEGLTEATYLHEPGDLAGYADGFDIVWRAAATSHDSRMMLVERIAELEA